MRQLPSQPRTISLTGVLCQVHNHQKLAVIFADIFAVMFAISELTVNFWKESSRTQNGQGKARFRSTSHRRTATLPQCQPLFLRSGGSADPVLIAVGVVATSSVDFLPPDHVRLTLRQRGSRASRSVMVRLLLASALIRAITAITPRAIQNHGAKVLVPISAFSVGLALRLSELGRTAVPLACPSRVAEFAGLLSPGSA